MTDSKFRITVFVLLAMIIGCGGGGTKRTCTSNLSAIIRGCKSYAVNNEENWPKNLHVLVELEYVPDYVFQCPDDPRQRECGYLYVQPAILPEVGTFILCDLKGNHDQARRVMFNNGLAEVMTEAEFQVALKLPCNATFAAALEKVGG